MNWASALYSSAAATGIALVLYACLAAPGFAQPTRPAINIGANDLGGTVWGTSLGFPGYIVRLNPGADPARTALAEIYEPPLPGYGPRGGDIDRNGVVWASLASGHLCEFDRRKCKVLNGPSVHVEGGKGTRPKVVKFQLRPDPLAR